MQTPPLNTKAMFQSAPDQGFTSGLAKVYRRPRPSPGSEIPAGITYADLNLMDSARLPGGDETMDPKY
jgi:hypothetical protein